jgi:hypothetical protein
MRSGFIVGVLSWGVLAVAVAPAQATINFTRAADVPVGSTPVAVASGDFDGDGKVDIAVANNDSGDVSVLYGIGDGTFSDASAALQVSTAPAAVAVGDFNGDSKLDLVVADENDNTVSILLNQGGRVFAAPVTVDTGSAPASVVVGDFNHDGKLDAVTADDLDDTVTVLLGVGDGTLLPGVSYSVGGAPLGLVAVDFNGDHNLDLAVTNSFGGPDSVGSLTVLLGQGDGTFIAQPEIEWASLAGPGAITSADFNGDGKADLAIANEGSEDVGMTVAVLLGDGTGTAFSFLPSPFVGEFPTGIVAADFDGDGKVDLATSNNFDDNVSVLIGVGDGTFNSKVDFSVAPPPPDDAAPAALVTADFNGDGKPDLATANENEDNVSVLLNGGSVTPVACAGDCDGSGDVTVNEIIVLVNITLGSAEPSACLQGIPSGRDVDITLVIAAVSNALNACPAAN